MNSQFQIEAIPAPLPAQREPLRSAFSLRLGLFTLLTGLLSACGSGSGTPAATSNVLPIGGGGNPPAASLKVLFIGDQFTSTNDMPTMLEGLATSSNLSATSATQIPSGIVSPSGDPIGTLAVHAINAPSLSLIDSDDWDFVVLQDESSILTLPFELQNVVTPAVNTLDSLILSNDPTTSVIMFQTWGYDQGGQFSTSNGSSPDFLDFDAMQDSLTASYDQLAQSIGADVAPVGEAWRIARATLPPVAMHDATGIDPSVEGSYLAACVFYATIYNQSPVGQSFTAGLSQVTATSLQQIAAESVWGPTCGLSIYGTNTVPLNTLSLTPTGNPSIGGTVSLTPGGLQPFEAGAFIYSSFSDAFLPLANGTLLIDLTKEVISRRFIANGTAWTFTIPIDPQLAGLDLFFQVINGNPSIVGDPLFSPAVKMQICP